MHHACAAVRASPKQAVSTLKFVEALLKVQYPVYLADKGGNAPLTYLMQKDVSNEILFKVFEWHLKYADFKVLQKPKQRYETKGQSFLQELINSGRATVKTLTLIKP